MNYENGKDVININTVASLIQDGFSTTVSQLFLFGFPCIFVGFFCSNEITKWLFFVFFMYQDMNVPTFFLLNNVKHVMEQEKLKNLSDAKYDLWIS